MILKNYSIGPISAAGRTVTEAKKSAMAKVEAALKEDYTPRVLCWRGNVWAVWRTPAGIESARIDENGKTQGVCMYGHSGWQAVCDSVAMSMAQLGADIESDELPAILPESKINDYVYWIGFQRAYRHAKGTDDERHAWACKNSLQFEPALCRAVESFVENIQEHTEATRNVSVGSY